MPVELAFDQSARTYDEDGRLHIACSHISKATVNPYYGIEVPGYESLGLDPGKIYYFLRSPEELAKASSTFERLPILSKHIPVTAEVPRQDLIVGAIGSEVFFEDPYLNADTTIWVDSAIGGIETEVVREFSCAYHWVPVMVPGEYRGEKYDGIMTEIRGNHLALVELGRAGSDVIAADSRPKFKFWENQSMKMTKLGKALFVAIGGISPKLAADSALPALLGEARKKTFNKDETTKKLIALDSSLSAEQLGIVMDAMTDMEDEPEPKEPKNKKPAEDEETEEEKTAREKKEKQAQDEAEEKERDEKNKSAMDSFKRELRDADEARRAVRSVVGDVIAHDSAADIYGFALDHLKVDHAGITEVPALKALFSLAASKTSSQTAPKLAHDAAGLAAKFPAATRFRQA